MHWGLVPAAGRAGAGPVFTARAKDAPVLPTITYDRIGMTADLPRVARSATQTGAHVTVTEYREVHGDAR